ncbi:MAG TPA: single-stranded-DNA-specific exonuclease RecJ [Caldithrix abyssi]|uniref:Single-stranded-DNA-specific exonuclease RecJ n=1 Tax=Caldithrix abyssi TaxID=187145 RepID=A0A7V5PQJ3_CALAY|nr:single-stranded-DNA-specific exonuclease RecJ [Caldithrix abyssi]
MLPKKRWKILNTDVTRSVLDVILDNRNLPPEHLEPFKLSDRLHDPYRLPDMERAVERILQAIEQEEKIIIFGDYDVDGITSTALMIYFFRKVGLPVEFMLPSREKDGYGLRPSSVEQIAAKGATLIITVDNGITAHAAVDRAAELGIDVVITDHHLQEGTLPQAYAVVNPNRVDSDYPFKTICGVAVVFKLVYALGQKLWLQDDYKQFLLNHLDLVAVGTIADVMPLRDENYAMVKFGLKVLAGTRKPGLVELKKISGVKDKVITPITVGYFLAPRLNASGRLEEADISVKLLISESDREAKDLAAYLDKLNRKRQVLQTDYLNHALDSIKNDPEEMEKVIFVENEKWQPGLIGLVSGQLKERFSRPAFAFTRDEQGNYVGSARSIDAFHVTNALTHFSHYFLNYGGHHKAAGLTIAPEKYESFKREFIDYARELIRKEDLVPELVIDTVVDIDQINMTLAKLIQEVGPFGETNPEPIFMMESATIREMITMTNGKHLKLHVQKGNQIFECVWWNHGEYKDVLSFGQQVDLAFRLTVNNWQGTERLQLTLEDIREA